MTIRIITNLILVYETLLSVFSRFAFCFDRVWTGEYTVVRVYAEIYL